MIKRCDNGYLNFIDEALEHAKSIPKYFSKYSKKTYCNHQKFAISVLMQKLKTTTRGIVSFLKSNEDAKLHLGLNKVPSHSTIVKFFNKVKESLIYFLELRKQL